MKKKISIILVLILTFALGFIFGAHFKLNNGNLKTLKEDLEASTSNIKEKNKALITSSPIEYTVVEISTDTLGASTVLLSLKNNGEDTLKNIEFYLVAWDINGYPLKLDFGREDYVKVEVEQLNILKDETKNYGRCTNSFNAEKVGQYEVVPYKAEFYDGTVWEDDNAEDKAKELFKEVRN